MKYLGWALVFFAYLVIAYALRDENAELRGALEEIRDCGLACNDCAEMARAALAPRPEPEQKGGA